MATSSRPGFSFSATWDDVVRLARPNAGVLSAIAGAFLVLPDLLLAYFVPRPKTDDFEKGLQLLLTYFQDNWAAVLGVGLVGAVGMVAILLLLLGRDRLTVGAAIAGAPMLLAPYFLAGVLGNLIVFAGTLLLILPGLYLFGRLALAGTVVVAERRTNPIEALRRSFEITRGRGWAVLGFVLIIVLAAMLVVFAVGAVVGSLLLLAAGAKTGAVLVMLMDAVVNAGVELLLALVCAAVYRQLA